MKASVDEQSDANPCSASGAKNEILQYGLRVLRPRHHKIREIKRLHTAGCHGFRLWPSSWLLMDFLNAQGLRKGSHIMELGCGWGLAGIFCAKNCDADVTSVDIDPEVFPYLDMHTRINHVSVSTINLGFDDLICDHLKGIEVMIGADICFLDSLVVSLRNLINRALDVGVQFVAIADPGRTTFEKLGSYFVGKMNGEVRGRSTRKPYPIEGRVLSIGTPPH